MKLWDTVVIVGVGLIGGSIGLDLRAKKLARRVIGVGRRAASLKAAKAAGCVTDTTLRLDRAAAEADLVIVCTPVDRIADDVRAAAAREGWTVRGVLEGEVAIPRRHADHLLAELRRRDVRRQRVAAHTDANLTDREWEILQMLDEGAATAEIANAAVMPVAMSVTQ